MKEKIEEKVEKYLNELKTGASTATLKTRKDGKEVLVDVKFDTDQMNSKEADKIKKSLEKALEDGEIEGGAKGNFVVSFTDTKEREAKKIVSDALEKKGFQISGK